MEEVIVVDTESRIAQAIISCLSMIGDEASIDFPLSSSSSLCDVDARPQNFVIHSTPKSG